MRSSLDQYQESKKNPLFSYKVRQKDIKEAYVLSKRLIYSPKSIANKPVKALPINKPLNESLSKQQVIDLKKIENTYQVDTTKMRLSLQSQTLKEASVTDSLLRRSVSKSVDLSSVIKSPQQKSRKLLRLSNDDTQQITLTPQKVLASPLVTKFAMANKSLQDAQLKQILSNMRTSFKPRAQIPISPPLRLPNAIGIENLAQQKTIEHMKQASSSKTYKLGFGLRSPKDLQPLKAFPLKIQNCECNRELFKLNDSISLFDREENSFNQSNHQQSNHDLYKDIGLRTLQLTFQNLNQEFYSKSIANTDSRQLNINDVRPEISHAIQLKSPPPEIIQRPEKLVRRPNSTLLKISYPSLQIPHSSQDGSFLCQKNKNQRYHNQLSKEKYDSVENDNYFDSDDYQIDDNKANKNINKMRAIRFKRENTIINPVSCNQIGRINHEQSPQNQIVSLSLTSKDVSKIYRTSKTSFKK